MASRKGSKLPQSYKKSHPTTTNTTTTTTISISISTIAAAAAAAAAAPVAARENTYIANTHTNAARRIPMSPTTLLF